MRDLALLILQAKQGDVAAYSDIVRRFQDTAVGYAYGILGNHDSAKDAAQEAFIEAYACLGELRESRAFSAWFRRIIFKQCDRITRRRSLAVVPLEVADNVPTRAPGPVEIYEQRELEAFVATALQQLPEEQRLAITLFYLSGYSHQEVADFLNLKKSQVNNRLYSARNKLKERMFAMTKEALNEQRPSNDDRFANQVIDRIRLANPLEDFPRIAELLSADAFEAFGGRHRGGASRQVRTGKAGRSGGRFIQNTITERMLLPSCISSKAWLMSSRPIVCVTIGSMRIVPFRY